MKTKFYGWWVTAACFVTFGLSVGIPYYGGPFFYDYYEKTFGWSRSEITFGYPLAATLTLWVGPLVVHKVRSRWLILMGTAATCIALVGFGTMKGSLAAYYTFWFIYIVGYILAGPIPHQVMISQWFRKHRGKAMAIAYLGVGVFGGISAKFVAKPLTEAFGFQTALVLTGLLLLLAWPIAIFVLRDRPADVGQFPDGEEHADTATYPPPKDFRYLVRRAPFWLLMVGSFASIGAIGSINQHMKFVFREQGFTDQAKLDALFSDATFLILLSSIGGRIFMGWAADRYPKKFVMVATYFLVASTIPLLLLVKPHQEYYVYLFSVLFGFGMGADYMLIPLMAAEQFGVNTLARAMAIILPTDTIGQTWCPYLVSELHRLSGGYGFALNTVFLLAFAGAVSVAALPRHPKIDETLHLPQPGRT